MTMTHPASETPETPSAMEPVRPPPTVAMQRSETFAPHDFMQLQAFSKYVFESGLAKGCDTPAAVAVLVMTGHELGLSAMQSLRGLYPLEGKAGIYSDTMLALAYESGKLADWEVLEKSDARCEIRAQRKGGHPVTREYTHAMAEKEGLVKAKGPHETRPATMNYHRCAANILREILPEVFLGLYVPEEIITAEADVGPLRVIPARQAAPRTEVKVESVRPASEPAPSQDPPRDEWGERILACEALPDLMALSAPLKAADMTPAERKRLGGLFQDRKAALSKPAETPRTREPGEDG